MADYLYNRLNVLHPGAPYAFIQAPYLNEMTNRNPLSIMEPIGAPVNSPYDLRFIQPFAKALSSLFIKYPELPAQISSGIRTKKEQEELRKRYEAGDPRVVVPPAINSQHSPQMRSAIDIDPRGIPQKRWRDIVETARRLGLGYGGDWRVPDSVHFYLPLRGSNVRTGKSK